jgi:hypothetical protein
LRYRGRNIDPVKLWDRYVELPANAGTEETFLPKVVCPNPDHDTLKRHFQINVDQPTVHCFAHCGISGSYEHAICIIEGLYLKFKVEEATSEKERKRRVGRAQHQARKIIHGYISQVRGRDSNLRPRRKLAGRSAKAVPAPESLEYATFLPELARGFARSRGISSSSIAKWRLGYDPSEARLVIPAYDEKDVLRFLIKRAIRPKDQPKYLYTEGFPKTSLLFGACGISPGIVRSNGIVLVEGSIDAIVLQQYGIPAAAILGTGISRRQCEILSRMRPRRIYFMFDRDSAGVTNIEIAARRLSRYPCYVCRFPKGRNDPAELSGREAMRSIDRAVPARRWLAANYPNAIRRRGAPVG